MIEIGTIKELAGAAGIEHDETGWFIAPGDPNVQVSIMLDFTMSVLRLVERLDNEAQQ